MADVGVLVGLYRLLQRSDLVRVVFEPDPSNFTALKAHVELNRFGIGLNRGRPSWGCLSFGP
jgi:hypothetical protein